MATNPINVNKALTLIYFNNLILGELSKNGINCWIAGGALRDYFSNIPLKSVCDIFFPTFQNIIKQKITLIQKVLKQFGKATTE